MSTYRFQFNSGFRFADAARLVPYLERLGIRTLYASPLLRARKGSLHGYDVADPTELNPELGTKKDFDALVDALRERDMRLLVDIVPNHMAASTDNPWWVDVLENGPASRYARWFDIEWQPQSRTLRNKVLLPVLGCSYGKLLAGNELKVRFSDNGFLLQYYELELPLTPKSYGRILRPRRGKLESLADEPGIAELKQTIAEIEVLPSPDDETAADKPTAHERERLKARLWRLYQTRPAVQRYINAQLRALNRAKAGQPNAALRALLSDQAYALCFWRTADYEINYRRFFAVSDLVAIRVEDPEVFEATHGLIFKLSNEGKLSGVRVDHIDGLYDPENYLKQLQRRLGAPDESTQAAQSPLPLESQRGGHMAARSVAQRSAERSVAQRSAERSVAQRSAERNVAQRSAGAFVLVEKILANHEQLPRNWPVSGTTGYEFLNALNDVFIDPDGAEAVKNAYARFLRRSEIDFAWLAYEKKKQVIATHFVGEMQALSVHLEKLAERCRARGLSRRELMHALVEMIACFPVYRTYINGFRVNARDRGYVEMALKGATEKRTANTKALAFLRKVLLLEGIDKSEREDALRFVMRFQQFTGPIVAKGVEDTALYVYNALVSRNEVGGTPEARLSGTKQFHERIQMMQTREPGMLHPTGTHDTKRGEDVRARINVLAEIPREWSKKLHLWTTWNERKRKLIAGKPVPEPNMEVLLYQTLLGAWPLSQADLKDFSERIKAYMQKAAREAKVQTRWVRPNTNYEHALSRFVDALLEGSPRNRFLQDFIPFQQKVARFGAINGLAQQVLKICAPGIPDFYQGSELWDLRLVDPDNRAPVDYKDRVAGLERPDSTRIEDLLENWPDGRIKLFVIARALNARRSRPELFESGTYEPLQCTGTRSTNVCAFARSNGAQWALAIVPRLPTQLEATPNSGVTGRNQLHELPVLDWRDTQVRVPRRASRQWKNVFTGEVLSGDVQSWSLANLLRSFPAAMLLSLNS